MGPEELDKVQVELALQYLTSLIFLSRFPYKLTLSHTESTTLSPILTMPLRK